MTVQRQLSVEDWMEILRRKKWLLIVPAVICAVGALIVAMILPKQYTSHARVVVESPVVPEDVVKPVVSDDVNRRLASMQGEILSRTHLESLIQQFNLYPGDRSRVPMETLADRLRKAISVAPMAPTPGTLSDSVLGFNIDVTLDHAKLAQDVCSEVATMFRDENLKERQATAEETTEFLNKQLTDAKAKLDDQAAKLAAFQDQYLGAQPEDEQTNLTVLAGLSPQLEAVTQSLSQEEENKAFTQSMLDQQIAVLKSSSTGGNPQTVQQQLADLQTQLANLRARYTDKHPAVVALEGEIADLQKKMQSPAASTPTRSVAQDTATDTPQVQQLRAELNQADTAIAEKKKEQAQLQAQIKGINSRIELTPMVKQQYDALTRDHDTALNFYNDLLKKRDDAEMATELEYTQEGQNFRVLDAPSYPEEASFPDRRIFALSGLAIGLVLGAVLIRISEMRDKSLRLARDVEALLGVPTLAVISSRDHGPRGSARPGIVPILNVPAPPDSRSAVR